VVWNKQWGSTYIWVSTKPWTWQGYCGYRSCSFYTDIYNLRDNILTPGHQSFSCIQYWKYEKKYVIYLYIYGQRSCFITFKFIDFSGINQNTKEKLKRETQCRLHWMTTQLSVLGGVWPITRNQEVTLLSYMNDVRKDPRAYDDYSIRFCSAALLQQILWKKYDQSYKLFVLKLPNLKLLPAIARGRVQPIAGEIVHDKERNGQKIQRCNHL
jgi:hypothetical protein